MLLHTRTDPKDPSRIKTKRKQKLKEDETGELGSTPGLGRSPGEGKDNPLQYSCLGNPRDRGAWLGAVHGVAKSQTQSESEQLSLTHTLFGTKVCTVPKVFPSLGPQFPL